MALDMAAALMICGRAPIIVSSFVIFFMFSGRSRYIHVSILLTKIRSLRLL